MVQQTSLRSLASEEWSCHRKYTFQVWNRKWLMLRRQSCKGPVRLEKYKDEATASVMSIYGADKKIIDLTRVERIERLPESVKKHGINILADVSLSIQFCVSPLISSLVARNTSTRSSAPPQFHVFSNKMSDSKRDGWAYKGSLERKGTYLKLFRIITWFRNCNTILDIKCWSKEVQDYQPDSTRWMPDQCSDKCYTKAALMPFKKCQTICRLFTECKIEGGVPDFYSLI